MDDPVDVGLLALTPEQRSVVEDCLLKGSGGVGLAVPMGFGKTLTSLVVALMQSPDRPTLVVMSKTLLEVWKGEIKKFFGSSLKVATLHSYPCSEADIGDARLVLATIDTVRRFYREGQIQSRFVELETHNPGQFNQFLVNKYRRPSEPFSKTPGNVVYGIRWGCLVVDEVQRYTNALSQSCHALAAVCAPHRLALSGTVFDEPKSERILGFHLIIDAPEFPRTMPLADALFVSPAFPGVEKHLVRRYDVASFRKPQVRKVVVEHSLMPQEERVYTSIKGTMRHINRELKRFKSVEDVDNARRFSSYLMAVLTYLRQCAVCPLLPVAKASVDIADLANKSHLSDVMVHEVQRLDLAEWLEDPDAARSSRLREMLKVLDAHAGECVVVFTCFRTCIDLARHFVSGRRTFTLTSAMSAKKRHATLDDFRLSGDGVLFLTYDIGGEGLNLQFASSTMLFLDFWWNDGRTSQAEARILRPGQTRDVTFYYFTSNTGVECAVLNKQFEKLSMLEEMRSGPIVTQSKRINVSDIIKLIDAEDNRRMVREIVTRGDA